MTSGNQKYFLFILFTALFSLIEAQEIQHFKPGEIWPDENGVHINAHGGGVIYYDENYYWFGEHKIPGEAGNSAQVGVSCYSSKDLLNWRNEGIALRVTFVLPVQGKKDALIFMADRWTPGNPIDGRYVWLPMLFENGKPVLRWIDKWDLSVFSPNGN